LVNINDAAPLRPRAAFGKPRRDSSLPWTFPKRRGFFVCRSARRQRENSRLTVPDFGIGQNFTGTLMWHWSSRLHGAGAMPSQSDVFNKAAECERLMNLQTDDIQKSAYRCLLELWIALANECASMSPNKFAREFDDLQQILTRFQDAKRS
jgi:hypothetical protein